VLAALRAGIHGLAHAAYVDSATASHMRRNGMFMIPTLTSLARDSSPASSALRESIRIIQKAGVTLVFGTDGGVLPHGANAREFATLAAVGVPLLDVLRAATVNAATAFGIADSVGTVAAGKVADIIAIEGDPLTDPSAYQRVRFVMQGGRMVVGPPTSRR
jgi:imidazolonepropionase-like amidohydrolase